MNNVILVKKEILTISTSVWCAQHPNAGQTLVEYTTIMVILIFKNYSPGWLDGLMDGCKSCFKDFLPQPTNAKRFQLTFKFCAEPWQ